MKILQINSADKLGGGERHLIDLANGLGAYGHEVVLAVRRDNAWSAKIENAATDRLPLLNAVDIFSAGKIASLIRRAKIDIVHAHVARDYTIAAAASRLTDTPLVITRHLDRRLGSIHRLTLRCAERVIAVSHGVAKVLGNQGYVGRDKLTVVHNGVDTKRLGKSAELADGSPIVVATVGELAWHKGHEDFIRAAARVVELYPETKFRIIGRDGSKSQHCGLFLKSLAASLNLDGKLSFIDWIDEPSEIYENFGIFVSSAHNEPFGLAIAEAMACGKAIVATETVGARELLTDNESGKLVSIGNPEELAAGIIEFIASAELRRRLGENACDTAGRYFSVEKMVAGTDLIYREILESRTKRNSGPQLVSSR